MGFWDDYRRSPKKAKQGNPAESAAPTPSGQSVAPGAEASQIEERKRQLEQRELRQREKEVQQKEVEDKAKQWTGIGCGGIIVLILLVIVIAVIAGDDGGPEPNEAALAVKKACASEVACVVRVDVGQVVGIDVDRELLLAQDDYWIEIAKQPKLTSAKVILVGDVVDQFGNPSKGKILNVACDRKAFTRLNWGSNLLEPDQVKRQCEWFGIAEND